MNTCVSDNYVVVNIQGIRYVTWGESKHSTFGNTLPYFVTVTYKGNHQTFYYPLESEARNFFTKIREAMDRTVIAEHIKSKQ